MAETVSLLDREMYRDTEAARLLGVPSSTLRWWLEGKTQDGVRYEPVLRDEQTGSRTVTWGEFIEAALIKQYRRDHKVKLGELREFRRMLKSELGLEYPLASRQPYVGPGQRLMEKTQLAVGLDARMWLVVAVDGQYLLTAPGDSFIRRVDWEDGIATRWRPHDDENSPVRMDPRVRFGLPSVEGVKTTAIWEYLEGGADFEEVAEDLDVSLEAVNWAYSYELSTGRPLQHVA